MLITGINKRRSLAPLLFLCLALAGCAHVGPYVDPPEADPMADGPGLFTGEKGYYSYGGDSKETDTKVKVVEEKGTLDPADFAEFEAYQRWKTEERNSKEYREFQQWQEYKKWKLEQQNK